MSDIEYNGNTLRWISNGGKVYKATSGLSACQNSKYQTTAKGGPIPSGTYHIRLVDGGVAHVILDKNGFVTMSPGWSLETVPKTADVGGERNVDVWGNDRQGGFINWGPNRWRLIKDRINDQKSKGRDGFYIHDSGKGYSHGCIEVDTVFFSDARKFMKEHRDLRSLSVSVNYRTNVITNGNTGNIHTLKQEIKLQESGAKCESDSSSN